MVVASALYPFAFNSATSIAHSWSPRLRTTFAHTCSIFSGTTEVDRIHAVAVSDPDDFYVDWVERQTVLPTVRSDRSNRIALTIAEFLDVEFANFLPQLIQLRKLYA